MTEPPDEIHLAIPFTYKGTAYHIFLSSREVLEYRDGAWVVMQNLDLRADILRAMNDGYGPEGD